jgi:hypothetical protein
MVHALKLYRYAVDTRFTSVLIAGLTSLFLLCPTNSFAIGKIGIDGSSYLYSSDYRPTHSETLKIQPDLYWEGTKLDAKLHGDARTFIPYPEDFTFEVYEGYLANSRKLTPLHQWTIGRRIYSWSVTDETWNLGTWNPRFVWEPLKFETVGLTGFFYQYQLKKWKITGFVSGVSVPERGYPTRVQNGKLESHSPYFAPLPSKLRNGSNDININYKIDQPKAEEVVLRPGGAVAVDFGESQGGWGKVSYGYMPVNQIDLALEAYLSLGDNAVNSIIHPRFYYHHLGTIESGYNGEFWSLWAGVTREEPVIKSAPTPWNTTAIGPAWIASTGGMLRWQEGLFIKANYLYIDEEKPTLAPKSIKVDLPSRFYIERALKITGRWDDQKPWTYEIGSIFDLKDQSTQYLAEVGFEPGRGSPKSHWTSGWTFGLGLEVISSITGNGVMGTNAGNDRVRGSVAYAF